ncbi:hypothetical protein [uncultured Algoriphagus sp.]|uniref:hypothetical protein n=1 Tax=uncultured Algoriphagus sp. TaxID=417365 RepID=UPI0030EB13AE
MKSTLSLLFILMYFSGCTIENPEVPKNSISYELYQASDFDFSGVLTVNELADGLLEFVIQLDGTKGNGQTEYLTHLHFGSYNSPDTPIALVLQPVNSASLKSTTILSELSDGSELTYEKIQSFSGHVKIHLDKEGPDYEVILAAGNIGLSQVENSLFDKEAITLCSKLF